MVIRNDRHRFLLPVSLSMDVFIEELINDIDKKIKRVQWSDEEIKSKHLQRSSHQIMDEGTTGFMNPCLDLTSIAYQYLRAAGLDTKFVFGTVRHNEEGTIRYHFGLEFSDNDNIYGLDFAKSNIVYFMHSPYKDHNTETSTIQEQKIDESIPANMPIIALANKINPDLNVPGMIDELTDKLVADNTDQNFMEYCSSLNNDLSFRIIQK